MADVDPKNLLGLVESLLGKTVVPTPVTLAVPLVKAILSRDPKTPEPPVSPAVVHQAAVALDGGLSQMRAEIATLKSRVDELQSAIKLHLLTVKHVEK